MAGFADVEHDVLDLVDEAIESGTDAAQLIGTAVGIEAAGQVAIAIGDFFQRTLHHRQAAQHARDQGTQHQRGEDGHQHGHDARAGQHGGQRSQRIGAVHRHHQQPVGAGHAGSEQHLLAAIQGQFLMAVGGHGGGQRLRGDGGIQVRQRLQAQLVIGVGDDLAAQVDQEGVAVGGRLDGHHVGHHAVEQHVGCGHGSDLAILADGFGKGHQQLAGTGAGIGRGQHRPLAGGRQLVPGALGRIVVGGPVALLREHGVLVGIADVGQVETTGGLGRLHEGQGLGGIGRLLDGRHHQFAGVGPFGNGGRLALRQLDHLAIQHAHGARACREEVGQDDGQHGQHDDAGTEGDESGTQGGRCHDVWIWKNCG